MTTPTPTSAPEKPEDAPRASVFRDRAPSSLPIILVKIVALAIVDGLGVYAIIVLIAASNYLVAVIAAIVLLAINWIYLGKRALPAKYLAPGLVFLGIFQVFVILYSAYIGFTNYGDGHNASKEDAISSIEQNSLVRVPKSPQYQVTVVEKGDTLGLLVTDPDNTVSIGDAKTPLSEVTNAELAGGKAISLPGWTSLGLGDLVSKQDAVQKLAVQLSQDASKGSLRTADGSVAYLYQPSLVYDAKADTFTDTKKDVVYKDNGKGEFASSGDVLRPGWAVVVGGSNFTKVITDPDYRGPVVGVLIWTFVFAGLSTFLVFAVGLFLAVALNKEGMRFRKFYRVVMILPYAFPGFLSVLIWAGLLNSQFGFINSVIFGGAEIPWLTDPWLAKLCVLMVNVWLGFPYMYLVATGALQSIPEEVVEAGAVDGASPWAVFSRLKLPLLLVSMAPILIGTFAFNFNNFNVIFLLTTGGPTDINAPIPVGATDILISLVYKIAFLGSNGRDYGLAGALSILIFVLIAVISIIAFRRTKSLEEVN